MALALDTAPSDREVWLGRRRIGASDAPALFGLTGQWTSSYALWARLRGLTPPSDGDEAEYQRWGHILEAPIAEEYERLTERKTIDRGPYDIRVHPTRPYMTCTPDRGILAFDDRGPGLLQIKTRAFWKADEWGEGAPLDTQVQVQHELAVTGYRWASIAVLIWGKPLRWVDVERNEPFIAMLEERCADLWRRVEENDPPPPDDSEATAKALRRAFPIDAGTEIKIAPPQAAMFERFEELRSARNALDKELQGLDNQIRAAFGEATAALLPDGTRWTLKTAQRAGYVVEPSTHRTLRKAKR